MFVNSYVCEKNSILQMFVLWKKDLYDSHIKFHFYNGIVHQQQIINIKIFYTLFQSLGSALHTC